MPLEKLLVKRMENEWDHRKPWALEPDNPGLIPSSATHSPAVTSLPTPQFPDLESRDRNTHRAVARTKERTQVKCFIRAGAHIGQ